MIGLKRGTVALLPHQAIWEAEAKKTIRLLKEIVKDAALDVQHVGSTAIRTIAAKPILDIIVGVKELGHIMPYVDELQKHGIVFRKEDVKGQLLFVMGDFERDTRTHHIHVVEWNSAAWKNYMNFRDYLNAFPERAGEYDALKKKLVLEFAEDRGSYTAGKQELIEVLLRQAAEWRQNQAAQE